MYTNRVFGTVKCVLFIEVSSFQGVLIKGFRCCKRCVCSLTEDQFTQGIYFSFLFHNPMERGKVKEGGGRGGERGGREGKEGGRRKGEERECRSDEGGMEEEERRGRGGGRKQGRLLSRFCLPPLLIFIYP